MFQQVTSKMFGHADLIRSIIRVPWLYQLYQKQYLTQIILIGHEVHVSIFYYILFQLSCLLQSQGIFVVFVRDHIQWSKEEAAAAQKEVAENSAVRVLLEEQGK